MFLFVNVEHLLHDSLVILSKSVTYTEINYFQCSTWKLVLVSFRLIWQLQTLKLTIVC